MYQKSVCKRSPIFGVGINDADYVVKPKVDGKQVTCIFYQTWKDMLKRCYYEKFHAVQPTYIDCSVSDDWLTFSNFKEWMKAQSWDGMELDKDLIIPNNKVYSKETCLFIPKSINLIMGVKPSRELPTGVYFNKQAGKFRAQINRGNGSKYIGSYNTAEEASCSYLKEKIKYILRIAESQEQKIKNVLQLYCEELNNEYKNSLMQLCQ